MNRTMTRRRPSRCYGEYTVRHRGRPPVPPSELPAVSGQHRPRLWDLWSAQVRDAYARTVVADAQVTRLEERLRSLLSAAAWTLFFALDAACAEAAQAVAEHLAVRHQ